MGRLTLEDVICYAKEIAKTNRAEVTYNFPDLKVHYDNCLECANQHNQLGEWLEELKSYKELEEQGLLVRLPVPIGTIVYCIYTGMTGKNASIFANYFNADMCKSWGKFVFTTKEEAEKKLKEMKKNA